jgi:hypothetical protein
MEIDEINSAIQWNLRQHNLFECTAVEASSWLAREGLLEADKTSPRRPLRALLRKGLIQGAKQQKGKGGSWRIRLLPVTKRKRA